VRQVPSYLTFEQALSRGYLGRIEDRKYLDWVKTLPCCSCDRPADDPHHVHGRGFKGMGTKVPDYFTIPLCRNCHDALHHDVDGWEDVNGPQMKHVNLTLLRGILEGKVGDV